MRKPSKKIALAGAMLIIAILLLAGCGSPTTQSSSQQQAETYAKGIASGLPTTQSSPALPPTPTPSPVVLSSHSNDWHFVSQDGYSYTITMKFWDPIPKADSASAVHPANSEESLGSPDNFDPDTDLVIPASISVEDTTPQFKTDIGVTIFYSGAGISPDNQIGVLQFSGGGPQYSTYSSVNDDLYIGPLEADFGSLTNGERGQLDCFIIVHNYFSPAMPQGDTGLLDSIIIRPLGYTNSQGMDFYDVHAGMGGTTDVGLTLSGRRTSKGNLI